MKLYELAHARTGDKGDISVISLIPYMKEDYEFLRDTVTAQRVKEFFSGIVQGEVTRYELPELHAFNFVMQHALGGGVTRSLAVDMHGKTLGFALLEMEVER